MRKLKITLLAAVATFATGLALAQSYTMFNLVRINSGLDIRGDIENQSGTVTIADDASVTGDFDVAGTLTAGSIDFGGSGAALTRVNDTNVTLTLGGSPTTALLDATSLTLGWTGQLAVSRGGTGAGTLTGLLQGNGTGAFTAITNSSTVGQTLRVIGANSYQWGALDLADTDAVLGVLRVENGGLNLSAALDDNLPLGDGTTWESAAVPDCDDSAGNHLNYDTTTNAFSCGTTGSGSASPGGADTQVQYNDGGAFGGDAGLTFNETTNDLTVGGLVNAVGALFTSAVELTYSTARVIIDDSSGTNNSCVQFQDNNVTQGFICSANAAGQVANASNAGDIVIRADNSGELIWTPDSGTTTVDITPSTGTFTITFDSACTTSPTMTLRYNKIGNMVIIASNSSGDAFNCTSDSTGFSDTGTPVPSAIRPAISTVEIPVHALDNGTPHMAVMLITTAGGVQINSCTTYSGSGNPCVGAWTNTGVKGLNNISGAYNINN